MFGDDSLYQEEALIPEPIQILHIDELANQAQLEAWSMFFDHLSYTLPEQERDIRLAQTHLPNFC